MKSVAGEKLKILTFAQKTQILFWSEQKVFRNFFGQTSMNMKIFEFGLTTHLIQLLFHVYKESNLSFSNKFYKQTLFVIYTEYKMQ